MTPAYVVGVIFGTVANYNFLIWWRWQKFQALKRAHFAAIHVDGGAVQPAAARRCDEGDEARNVSRRTEAGNADILAVPFAHLSFALAGAFHVRLDAPPEAFGLDVARVDA